MCKPAVYRAFQSAEPSAEFRRKLSAGTLPLPEFHGWLLRLVYRMIFLLVAEDRGLLHPPEAIEESSANKG